jgi:WhiB family redox-sensing transcriptional regulator
VTAALPGEWVERAACRRMSPALFFAVARSEHTRVEVKAAKAVCAICDVQEECLEFAIRTGQREGIWGGLTDRERRKVRQAVRAAESRERT